MNEAAENVVEMKDPKEDKGPSQEVINAFEAGVEADKSEEAIFIDMLQAGAKFNEVKKIYNELMVEAGLALSKQDKEEILAAAFQGADLTTEEGFDAVVSAVTSANDSITQKSAAGMVRAYARKNDVPYFKKPKGGGGTRTTFVSDYYDALFANPRMTQEEAHQIMVDKGTQNTLRWEKSHQKVRELVNRIAEQYLS